MDVQLFLNKVFRLLLWVVVSPVFLANFSLIEHGVLGDTITAFNLPISIICLFTLLLEFPYAVDFSFLIFFADMIVVLVQIAFFANTWVDTFAHDLFCICALDVLVMDTGFLFLLD
jgi:hypothetical protein